MTLNQIIKQFQTIATNHAQINSFYFGEFWDIATSGGVNYPMMAVILDDSEISGKVQTMNFTFIFMDIVKNGRVNEEEVLSDQLEIAKDVIGQLQHPSYQWEFDGDGVTLSDFTERFTDSVSGFTTKISLLLPYQFNRCAAPIDPIFEYSSEQSSSSVQNVFYFRELDLVSGTVNGVNAQFEFSHTPIQVYYNGQLLKLGTGYTISGNTVTLLITTYAGELIWAYGYR